MKEYLDVLFMSPPGIPALLYVRLGRGGRRSFVGRFVHTACMHNQPTVACRILSVSVTSARSQTT